MATAPKEMSGTWRDPQPGRRIRSGPEAQPTLVLLLEGIGSSKEIRSIASGDARILPGFFNLAVWINPSWRVFFSWRMSAESKAETLCRAPLRTRRRWKIFKQTFPKSPRLPLSG
jgi:hypothetical protein